MADISTFVGRDVWGNKAVSWGTYTDAGAGAGGTINTKLHMCEKIFLQPTLAAVSADASVVNATLPVAGASVTIVCDASEAGLWLAWGDSFA